MPDARTRYDNLLAPYYFWIFGEGELKSEKNRISQIIRITKPMLF